MYSAGSLGIILKLVTKKQKTTYLHLRPNLKMCNLHV